jgi:hypothetical protein
MTTEDGDHDDSDGNHEETELAEVLDRVKNVVHNFERRLDALQQQLLARGTRDVRKAAEDALAEVAKEAAEALKLH